MKPICHIVGSGDFFEEDALQLKNISKNDIIIAADGGYSYLKKYHLSPHMLVGDFDSLDITKSVLQNDLPIHRLPVEKDYTDISIAIAHGQSQGFRAFFLYGATGGSRIEHTIANIQLLAGLSASGLQARMYGRHEVFDVIHNNRIAFSAGQCGYISVFSLTDHSYGVCEEGLKYALQDYTLSNTTPLGISNEFTETPSTVSVREGTLLIISPR